MAKFKVFIKKTITTVIEVDSASVSQAKRLVADYGLVEAASDFKVLQEDVEARLSSVEAVA